jgi:hypothetical protein
VSGSHRRLAQAAVATALGLLTVTHVVAQQPASSRAAAAGDTSIFVPLALKPAPSASRRPNGRPGPSYWQQRADYTLRARLDTSAHTVHGTLELRYTNRSPDTLGFLWFHTEQNMFRAGSLNDLTSAPDSRFGLRRPTAGYVIGRFTQRLGRNQVALRLYDRETVMRVDLARPLAPGESTVLEAAWQFEVPERGADRMGRDGSLYQIAQWYPRVAVYDDVRGWNTEPYLGQSEFYLEYGDFTLEVTVPEGYVVAATGTLMNPAAVLTPTQLRRLEQVRTATKPVAIVSPAELRAAATLASSSGANVMRTWRFHARNVRDAVWAASPDYHWDALAWRGILLQAYYRPSARDVWGEGEAVEQIRASLEEYGDRWAPYPYPQMSAVEGLVNGMEYPMVAMQSRSANRTGLFGVLTHEVGHTWFPMLVGSNERAYGWQDEGFNTFTNAFAEARRYPEQGTLSQRVARSQRAIEALLSSGTSLPIMTPAHRLPGAQGGLVQYTKVAVGLHLLRGEILDSTTFDATLRAYMGAWAYKHPTPADFFRTVEHIAGRRLDWFWRGWFLTNARFDQGIGSVGTDLRGDTTVLTVRFRNYERGVLPLRVRITLDDGTHQDFVYPAEVWAMNSTAYVRQYAFPARKVSRVAIDPDQRLIDIDRGNNVWDAAP